MDARYKRLGKNTIIVFIGNTGSKIIGFLMLPFYTHWLSKAEYGISDLINTYSMVLLAMLTCCLSDSIFIFPKGKSDEEKSRYFTSGLIFVLFSFLVVAASVYLFRNLVDNWFVRSYIWWIVGMIYCTFLSNYMQQFTRSIDKMIIYSLAGIVYVATIAIVSFILLPLYKLDGYLIALLSACLISTIFALFASKSYKYFKISCYHRGSLIELLKYGIPLIPNSIMWWLVDGLNRPVMESNLGVEAIGIYAVANKMPGILSMLFSVFSNAWTISMLDEFGKPDFNQFFNKTMRMLFFVVSLGTVVIILGSKLLVGIFASSSFYEAWRYVPLLTIGVVFQNLSCLIGGVFAAEKKSQYFFYSSIWGAVCSVVLTMLLVHLYGLMGACVSISCSFLCMTLVRLKYAWKHINLFSFRYYTSIVLALVFLSVIYIWNQNVIMIIAATFIACSVILTMNRAEVKALCSLVKGTASRFKQD